MEIEIPFISNDKKMCQFLSSKREILVEKNGLCSFLNDDILTNQLKSENIFTEYAIVNAEISRLSAESKKHNENDMRLYFNWQQQWNTSLNNSFYYHQSISNFSDKTAVESTSDSTG